MATVQGVYLALFGRPADAGGLAYWNGVTKNGADLSLMLKELPALPEYTGRFTNMTNEQIVNSIYQALFGRDAEPAGLAGFVAALANGTQTISSIAVNILDGAQGSDKARIDAKLAASDIFTAHLDLPNEQAAYNANTIQIAKDYLSAVTENSPGTAALADAAIAKMLGQGGGVPNGGGGEVNAAPVFSSGEEASIDEHSSTDTVVYTGVATDDTSSVKYSLTGNDANAFNIDSLTGQVTFKASPDREVKDTYEIGVRASDSTGFSSVKDVTITVNDIVESATEDGDVIHWTTTSGQIVSGLGGNDDIKGGGGNDIIRGGSGHDDIDLSAGGKDRIILEASAVDNGVDTIKAFSAGSGPAGDRIQLLGATDSIESNGVSFSGAIGPHPIAAEWEDNLNGKVALLRGDNLSDVDTWAEIAAQFGNNQPFSLQLGERGYVLAGAANSQTVIIWSVENKGDAAVTAGDVSWMGTINLVGGQTINSFHADNFVFV